MSFAFQPFYSGDYYRDTRHLSMLQHGAYRLLLDHCWDQKGPLPLDVERCYRICGAVSKEEQGAVASIIGEFFVRMEDGHYNRRMQREIERADALSNVRSMAGKMGYQAKAKHLPSKSQASAKQEPLPPPPPPPPPLQPPQTPASVAPLGSSGEVSPDPSRDPSTGPSSGNASRKRSAKPARESKTVDVWNAYNTAYKERYGVDAVRNAKVNGQIAKFVERLGAGEAPGVARSYLANRNNLYVNAKHCTDLMLRDAEKLRTEWVTGNVTVTNEPDFVRERREKIFEMTGGRMGAKAKSAKPSEVIDVERLD